MSRLPDRVSFPQDRLPGICCPGCGADGLRSFYAVAAMPAAGDILLALCETCGLITNAAASPSEVPPADPRDANSSSPAWWSERYDLRGKTIVDVGCGQGEFLEMLCLQTSARGIGFDPHVRREQTDRADVLLVAGRFEDYAAGVKADLVFGRHALSRVAEPLAFLTAIREPLDATPVAFEEADMTADLRDGAFWNIGSSQRHFFTPASLTRLIQRGGFEPTRCDAFGDRTVLIEAEPTGGQKRDMPTLNELRLTSQFVRVCTARLLQWMAFAETARARRERTVIWGADGPIVNLLNTLGIDDVFDAAIDPVPAEHDRGLPGTRLRAESPATLQSVPPETIVFLSRTDRIAAEQSIAAMRTTPRIVCV